ncbi:unnamed protein product [Clonostachys byssicola]|uniref:AB hydrolase-1 domain-containing protein n=1 Tax=Clonostachys byssicola TaxID=160290 RepID=A0A9N9YCM6_9HYPO|nr:unnamed protein product [Clonostachys byssicola]
MTASKPLIAIVPGALHRPNAYSNFVQLLQQRGFEVLTPPLAVASDSETLDKELTYVDDVKNIHAQLLPLLDQGRKAIILSHSYGGLPAVASIEGQTCEERAARGLSGGIISYVAACAVVYPLRNKSLMGDDTEFQPTPYHRIKDGIVTVTDEARALWYSDLPEEKGKEAFGALLKKQTWKSFTVFPRYVENDLKIPKTYLLCEDDQAIPASWQELLVKNGSFDLVHRLKSGHAPFRKVPEEVAKILEEIWKNNA